MNVNFGNNAIVLGFSPVVIPACAGMTGFFAEWGGEGGGAFVVGILHHCDRRPSVGWGLSRLSASPDTRDGHQPSLVRRRFC